MRAVSLFSGVGGFELGFDRAGIQTVLQVERDPWCTSVLERHWPEVERLDDVRSVDAALLQQLGDDQRRRRAGSVPDRDRAQSGFDGRVRHAPGRDTDLDDVRQVDAATLQGRRRDVVSVGVGSDAERLGDAGRGRDNVAGVDLVYGGFPCFSAGTLVLTEDGYRPIEDLAAGDRVLSHTGRWRAVTSVMRRRADSTVILRGHGVLDVQTTDEHPFWSRQSGRRFTRRRAEGIHRSDRTWTDPEWTGAADMAGRHASQVLPIEPPPDWAGVDYQTAQHQIQPGGQVLRGVQPLTEPQQPRPGTADFWWIVGRYLADGWVTPSNGKLRVVICAAYKEADEVEERIRRCFSCTRDENRTTVKFTITRIGFARWLQQFGHRAFGKRIPGWVYSLSQPDADALLTGYLTGDGYYNPKRGWQFTSVSKPLALGVALLAQRARGVVASIGAYVPAERGDIEGRSVRQRPQYNVVIPDRHRSGFVEGNYGWKLIRSVRPAPGGEVFNISVEHDESYVADGCVVHNCQDVSVAGKRAGLSGERSGLWFEFERILRELRPTWAVIENVPGLLSSHYGRDFHRILLGLVDLGYGVAWRVVDARWFGVPQRRRRVFIVGCLGDARRAAQVLAVCESCGGYSAAGSQTREDVARTLDDGARRASVELPMIAASLSAGGHPESNMPGRHHEDDDNLVIGSGIDEGMARSLLSRSTGYRMDLESENFVVTNALDGGERGFAPRGDGADNLIAFQPNSSRTDEEWRENETPPVKKGSGGLGAVPPAFAGPQGVRRLTPLECERLMGWPEHQETLTIRVCSGQRKSPACAVSLSHRLQVLAGNVGNAASSESARSVGNTFSQNNPMTGRRAVVDVAWSCEDGAIALRIPGLSRPLHVSSADVSEWFALPDQRVDSARLAALMTSILALTTQGGRAEPQTSDALFSVHSNGERCVLLSGDEIAERASGVVSSIDAVTKLMRRTTSEVGPSFQSCVSMLVTLCSYVVSAISGHIPEPTLSIDSYDLNLSLSSGHTRWAADGRELSDSHRYRLCGNGVVAPVAEYIGHRLVEVSR